MWSMKSAAFVAIALWVFMLVYLSTQLFGLQGRSVQQEDRLASQLSEALSSLNELRTQNKEMRELVEAERKEHAERSKDEKRDRERLIEEMRGAVAQPPGIREEIPKIEEDKLKEDTSLYSKEHEIARRGLDSNIWEIFYYLHGQLKNHKELEPMRNHTENQLLSLLATSANLSDVDGGSEWRRKELKKLTDQIQTRIDRLQNPDDCSKAKTLICTLDKECGFGCQLHHVTFCFLTAFGSQRMMVLNENGKKWRYSTKGWVGAFLPVTKCEYKKTIGTEKLQVFSSNSKSRVVSLGIVDGLSNKPQHLPLSFPTSMADQMLTLHSNPPVFFVSQFIWYLMRSSSDMDKIIKHATDQIPFGNGPIVGLQVRRTDKVGTEAAFHSVEEYMEWAEIWFKVQEKRRGMQLKRKVYIASDDPQVVPETKKKYPAYEVYGDIEIANTAQMGSRYTDASLHGVVTDIRLLSQCDYLVCTFSSQVCRMGFELMQVLQGDAGESFHSLDDLYYYGGQFPHEQIAIESHTAETSREIDLQVGDVVGVAGNHWDGYSKGQNRRTQLTGLYPSYKTVEKWRMVDFAELN